MISTVAEVPPELAPVVEALADLLLADLRADADAPPDVATDDDEREAA